MRRTPGGKEERFPEGWGHGMLYPSLLHRPQYARLKRPAPPLHLPREFSLQDLPTSYDGFPRAAAVVAWASYSKGCAWEKSVEAEPGTVSREVRRPREAVCLGPMKASEAETGRLTVQAEHRSAGTFSGGMRGAWGKRLGDSIGIGWFTCCA